MEEAAVSTTTISEYNGIGNKKLVVRWNLYCNIDI